MTCIMITSQLHQKFCRLLFPVIILRKRLVNNIVSLSHPMGVMDLCVRMTLLNQMNKKVDSSINSFYTLMDMEMTC